MTTTRPTDALTASDFFAASQDMRSTDAARQTAGLTMMMRLWCEGCGPLADRARTALEAFGAPLGLTLGRAVVTASGSVIDTVSGERLGAVER